MPVFTEDDDIVQPEQPNLVIAPKEYETTVVDTRKEDYQGLASFYAGFKVAVDYYSQVQGRDNAAASFQEDLPVPYGTFHEIRGFEMIFEQPFTHAQNSGDVQGFNSSGSAVVYSAITPQAGDVFVVDIGNGRNALVQIHNPQRNTIYPEAGSKVDFKITKWMDASTLASLKARVVKTFFFDRENYRRGIKALLTDGDVDITKRLGAAYRRLLNMFYRDFYDENKMTFIMPGQEQLSYDPYVTRFMRRMVGVSDHKLAAYITELGVSDDVFSNQITLFDVIAAKDFEQLYSACHKCKLSSIDYYRVHPNFSSIYYSGVKMVISPIDAKYSVNNQGQTGHAGDDIVDGGVLSKDMDYILPALDLGEQVSKPNVGAYINPVLIDDYYVFSSAFYNDGPGKSNLEYLVTEMLKGHSFDLGLLADIADAAIRFDNLERFYYTPIILTLIKLSPGVL